MQTYIAPFRVGRHLGRAILDKNGLHVMTFPFGMERYAREYCDFLNENHSFITVVKPLKH